MSAQPTRLQLSRNGATVLAGIWLVLTYAAGSFALNTGSWLWYGLTMLAIWQLVKMAAFVVKNHGEN